MSPRPHCRRPGCRPPPGPGDARPLSLELAESLLLPGNQLPELALPHLLEQAGSAAAAGSSPFGQALLMLVRLLGEMHREHLELVREELRQLRRLNREIHEARTHLPDTRPPTAYAPPAGAGAAATAGAGTAPPGNGGPPERPDPQTVQAVVGERLLAWEQERQSRWRKILDLLAPKS